MKDHTHMNNLIGALRHAARKEIESKQVNLVEVFAGFTGLVGNSSTVDSNKTLEFMLIMTMLLKSFIEDGEGNE